MKWVLDLFAGTGSATDPFVDNGWGRVRVEADESFEAELHGDILEMTASDIVWAIKPHLNTFRPPFDFIWASPPCTSYSMGSVRHHWFAHGECECGGRVYRVSGEEWACNGCDDPSRPSELVYTPKSETAKLGRDLVIKTLELIEELNPPFWVIENPRATLRKMPWMEGLERKTISHCQYGDPRRMKPTDLWGVFPPGFEARICSPGAPCHEPAPRGAKTGTQGLSKIEAGMLPYDLGHELCTATEHALANSLHI